MDNSEELQGLPADIVEYEVREQRHPIHHRTTPLPSRVKSGAINELGLTVETANGVLEVPWDSIELMALGLIEEIPTNVEGPKGALRQMFGKMTGKGGDEDRKTRQIREIYLLDLFLRDQDQPLRIDSATVNYRSFLRDEMSYVSFQNFFRLVTRIARGARLARFEESLVAFFSRRRDGVRKYAAIYDYELELQQVRQRFDTLCEHSKLNLDRETWAEEWGDYA